MKHGILFFFNMGNLTMISRIALLPLAWLVLNMNMYASMYPIYVILLVIAFVLCFVHAPSDKSVKATLDQFHADVKEELKNKYGFRNEASTVILKGYKKSGKMRLRRHLKTEVIYPYPTVFIFAERSDKKVLIIATKTLLKKQPAEYLCFELQEQIPIEVTSNVENDNDKIAEVTIRNDYFPEGITIYAKNDYHYRDFMGAMKPFSKVN